jgi:signal peptidase I
MIPAEAMHGPKPLVKRVGPKHWGSGTFVGTFVAAFVENKPVSDEGLAKGSDKGSGEQTLRPAPATAKRRTWLTWACVLVSGVLFAHHFRLGIVSGESMSPTVKGGDWFLISKRAYATTDPARGDIVVARYDKELIIKRIVGLPGEEVEFKTGRLYIDGHPIAERQQIRSGELSIGRGRLGKGKFALLGDNRTVAPSQLVQAVVPRDHLLGKVLWTGHLLTRAENEWGW